MIAIETKYLPATNFKPSRICASTANGQRLVMSNNTAQDASNDTGSGELAARYVAQALADKMGWGLLRDCGATKSGFVFCFPSKG